MKMTVIPILTGVFVTIPKSLVRRLEVLDIREQVETIQTTDIVVVAQNTEKSPGDLRRLAVTQTSVKYHQLMLV